MGWGKTAVSALQYNHLERLLRPDQLHRPEPTGGNALTLSVRITDPQADYPALVGMLHLTEPEPHQHAQASGAADIRTPNNARNAPMLAINHKLGYRLTGIGVNGRFAYLHTSHLEDLPDVTTRK